MFELNLNLLLMFLSFVTFSNIFYYQLIVLMILLMSLIQLLLLVLLQLLLILSVLLFVLLSLLLGLLLLPLLLLLIKQSCKLIFQFYLSSRSPKLIMNSYFTASLE